MRDFIALVNSSILCVEITEDIKIDQTTCEDIIHSIYNLKSSIENMIDDVGMDYVIAIKFIQNMRQFLLKWHSEFFINVKFVGFIATSVPIDVPVSSDRIKCFIDDYIKLIKYVNKMFK